MQEHLFEGTPAGLQRRERHIEVAEIARQVGDALRAAVEADKPTVLNLQLTRELADPFRRDAFKQPIRLLDKYKAYSAKPV